MSDALDVTESYFAANGGAFDTRNRYISEATVSDRVMVAMDGESIGLNIAQISGTSTYEVNWLWQVGATFRYAEYASIPLPSVSGTAKNIKL